MSQVILEVDLDTNRMLPRAVVKAIEIVGEAAAKVSDDALPTLQTGMV